MELDKTIACNIEHQELNQEDLSEVSNLIESGEHVKALEAILSLLEEGFHDIRLICYAVFCDLVNNQVTALSESLNQLVLILEQHVEDLGPKKNFDKQSVNTFRWLNKKILSNIEYKVKRKEITVFDHTVLEENLSGYQRILSDKFGLDCSGDVNKIVSLLAPYFQTADTEEKEKVDENTGAMRKQAGGDTVLPEETRQIQSDNNSDGSDCWQKLKRKISIFRALMEQERFLEAAVFYKDIHGEIRGFDPRRYFPEVFFPLYESMTRNFDKVVSIIDANQNTLQWHIIEELYQVNPEAFIGYDNKTEEFSRGDYTKLSAYLKQNRGIVDKEGLVKEDYFKNFLPLKNMDDHIDNYDADAEEAKNNSGMMNQPGPVGQGSYGYNDPYYGGGGSPYPQAGASYDPYPKSKAGSPNQAPPPPYGDDYYGGGGGGQQYPQGY